MSLFTNIDLTVFKPLIMLWVVGFWMFYIFGILTHIPLGESKL